MLLPDENVKFLGCDCNENKYAKVKLKLFINVNQLITLKNIWKFSAWLLFKKYNYFTFIKNCIVKKIWKLDIVLNALFLVTLVTLKNKKPLKKV